MSDVVETEVSSAVVTVAGIAAENPLSITLIHMGVDVRGVERHFVQQVPVRNEDLARRALSELHKGDKVQVTVVNEWREDGCDTYLSDFKAIGSNGYGLTSGSSVAHNGSSQDMPLPVQEAEKILSPAKDHIIRLTPLRDHSISPTVVQDELNNSLKGETMFRQNKHPHFSDGEKEQTGSSTVFLADTDQWLVEANVVDDTSGHVNAVSIRFNTLAPYAKPPIGRMVCQLANVCKMVVHQYGKDHICPHASEDAHNYHDCTFCDGESGRVSDLEAEWVVFSE